MSRSRLRALEEKKRFGTTWALYFGMDFARVAMDRRNLMCFPHLLVVFLDVCFVLLCPHQLGPVRSRSYLRFEAIRRRK